MLRTNYVILSFIFFIIASCGSNSETKSNRIISSEVKNFILKDSSEIKLDLKKEVNNMDIDTSIIDFSSRFIGYCHELDYKYSDDSSSEKIDNWWNRKLSHLMNYSPSNTFFSSKGGGPNGAEWNTNCDLFYIAFFPLDSSKFVNEDVSVKIYINNKLHHSNSKKVRFFKHGVIVDFHIKSELWNNSLREILPNDYSCLYSENDLNLHYSGEREFMAPLNVGKMFKVDVILKVIDSKIKETDCFHIAFASC